MDKFKPRVMVNYKILISIPSIFLKCFLSKVYIVLIPRSFLLPSTLNNPLSHILFDFFSYFVKVFSGIYVF